jgi:DNA-binding response OmpR family regulator
MEPIVLLVDYDDRSRESLAELLKDSGYAILHAQSAIEGIRTAREEGPTVAVVDIWPSESALQMLERIRRDAATRDLPVILLTTSPAAAPPEGIGAPQLTLVLQKPCAADLLLEAIHRFSVGRRRIGISDIRINSPHTMSSE